MSDELLEIVDNIKQPSVWIRVLFMVVFGIASYLLLLPLIIILSIAQALFTLITGEPNENLRYFSATLVLYVSQIIRFLTYLSEDKPFPFSDFPELEDDSLAPATTASAAAQKANGSVASDEKAKGSATRKASAKKSPARKPARKRTTKKSPARKETPGKSDASDGNDS